MNKTTHKKSDAKERKAVQYYNGVVSMCIALAVLKVVKESITQDEQNNA